jgi:hypothetical protein
MGRLNLPKGCPTLRRMLPATLQSLIVMIASSINERMQKRLNYKTEEVVVLKEIIKAMTGKARIDFTDNQRGASGRQRQGAHAQRARGVL